MNYKNILILFSILIFPSIVYHKDVMTNYAEKFNEIGKNIVLNANLEV